MKCPGYIEGPWFPPEIRKSRIRPNNALINEMENIEDSDVDLDDVDFIILPTKTRDSPLRPGRAERVVPLSEDSSMGPTNEHGQHTSAGIFSSYQSGVNGDSNGKPSSIDRMVPENRVDQFPTEEQKVHANDREERKLKSKTFERVKQALAEADRIIHESTGDLPETVMLASQLPEGVAVPPVDTTLHLTEECQQNEFKRTLFTRMSTPFTEVTIDEGNNIDTKQFLNACKEIPMFLDLLGGRALAPLKADINGNIDNLEKEHQASPATTQTLQTMLLRENPGNARGSLLWLNRGLLFLDCFLTELLTTEDETADCVRRAYDNSLRPHHNFAVRAIFRTVLFAVPSRKHFLALLLDCPKDALSSPDFAQGHAKLLSDARTYSEALHTTVSIILKFYEEHNF